VGGSDQLRSEGAKQEGIGFTDLSTDSDYNHLVRHVNANRLPRPALTCCDYRVFSISANLAIYSLIFPERRLFAGFAILSYFP